MKSILHRIRRLFRRDPCRTRHWLHLTEMGGWSHPPPGGAVKAFVCVKCRRRFFSVHGEARKLADPTKALSSPIRPAYEITPALMHRWRGR